MRLGQPHLGAAGGPQFRGWGQPQHRQTPAEVLRLGASPACTCFGPLIGPFRSHRDQRKQASRTQALSGNDRPCRRSILPARRCKTVAECRNRVCRRSRQWRAAPSWCAALAPSDPMPSLLLFRSHRRPYRFRRDSISALIVRTRCFRLVRKRPAKGRQFKL